MPDLKKETEAMVTWKEIAEYLRVSVPTAKRWRKKKGMPVKCPGGKVVRAFADELDTWQRDQWKR